MRPYSGKTQYSWDTGVYYVIYVWQKPLQHRTIKNNTKFVKMNYMRTASDKNLIRPNMNTDTRCFQSRDRGVIELDNAKSSRKLQPTH